MGRKGTKEVFVEKAIKVHGNKFDYSKVVYVGSTEKVIITCTVHNQDFLQEPRVHLSGHGSKCCQSTALSNTQKFVEKAKVVHSKLYTYERVAYINNRRKVKITCLKHGDFLQSPDLHLLGGGCQKCKSDKTSKRCRSNTQDFIVKAMRMHGNTYDYSLVDYKTSVKHVKITCAHHGVFLQAPGGHLSGGGCPSCVDYGFSVAKPAHLYVMSCGDITKVGITNRLPSVRAEELSRAYGAEFSVLKANYFEIGHEALAEEANLLKELRLSYDNPCLKFSGSTECFVGVDVQDLLLKLAA